MSETVLKVTQLVKTYGTFTAVGGLSFDIPKGKVIGLLGPNGAGKTTTIQMLLGITLPTAGTIEYFGHDFHKNRKVSLQRINFTSAFNTLQGKITSRENLIVYAELYGVVNAKQKIDELAKRFEITEFMDHEYYTLSAGQKTRVNLTKSLLNDPELILMDEPTASLDPDIADKTLTLIEELRKERSLSILYTSHNMNEVDRICDEVIIMDRGKIVAHDTPLGLRKLVTTAQLRITFDGNKHEVEKYLQSEKATHKFHDENVVHIDTKETEIPGLIFKLSKIGIWITDIEIKKPTLEDVFIQIARRYQS